MKSGTFQAERLTAATGPKFKGEKAHKTHTVSLPYLV